MRGKVLQQRDLLIGKRPNLLAVCCNDTEQCVVRPEGHHQQRAHAGDLIEASDVRRKFLLPVVRHNVGKVKDPTIAHRLRYRIVLTRRYRAQLSPVFRNTQLCVERSQMELLAVEG